MVIFYYNHKFLERKKHKHFYNTADEYDFLSFLTESWIFGGRVSFQTNEPLLQ